LSEKNNINNKKDISPKIKIRKRKSQNFLLIFNESKNSCLLILLLLIKSDNNEIYLQLILLLFTEQFNSRSGFSFNFLIVFLIREFF